MAALQQTVGSGSGAASHVADGDEDDDAFQPPHMHYDEAGGSPTADNEAVTDAAYASIASPSGRGAAATGDVAVAAAAADNQSAVHRQSHSAGGGADADGSGDVSEEFESASGSESDAAHDGRRTPDAAAAAAAAAAAGAAPSSHNAAAAQAKSAAAGLKNHGQHARVLTPSSAQQEAGDPSAKRLRPSARQRQKSGGSRSSHRQRAPQPQVPPPQPYVPVYNPPLQMAPVPAPTLVLSLPEGHYHSRVHGDQPPLPQPAPITTHQDPPPLQPTGVLHTDHIGVALPAGYYGSTSAAHSSAAASTAAPAVSASSMYAPAEPSEPFQIPLRFEPPEDGSLPDPMQGGYGPVFHGGSGVLLSALPILPSPPPASIHQPLGLLPPHPQMMTIGAVTHRRAPMEPSVSSMESLNVGGPPSTIAEGENEEESRSRSLEKTKRRSGHSPTRSTSSSSQSSRLQQQQPQPSQQPHALPDPAASSQRNRGGASALQSFTASSSSSSSSSSPPLPHAGRAHIPVRPEHAPATAAASYSSSSSSSPAAASSDARRLSPQQQQQQQHLLQQQHQLQQQQLNYHQHLQAHFTIASNDVPAWVDAHTVQQHHGAYAATAAGPSSLPAASSSSSAAAAAAAPSSLEPIGNAPIDPGLTSPHSTPGLPLPMMPFHNHSGAAAARPPPLTYAGSASFLVGPPAPPLYSSSNLSVVRSLPSPVSESGGFDSAINSAASSSSPTSQQQHQMALFGQDSSNPEQLEASPVHADDEVNKADLKKGCCLVVALSSFCSILYALLKCD